MFTDPNPLLFMNVNDPKYTDGTHRVYETTVDELKQLKDAGITTVVMYWRWFAVERTFGKYDWSELDHMVERARAAGMKLVLSGWLTPLQCAPVEWYAAYESGEPFREILSFWNPDAQGYSRDFYRRVVEHVRADDVMVAMCEYLTGESVLWNIPVYYDEAARASHHHMVGQAPSLADTRTLDWLCFGACDHYVSTQAVLEPQHHEIWEDLKRDIALQSLHNATFAQADIQQACKVAFPEATYTLLQYTYFNFPSEYHQYVRELQAAYGPQMKLIVEANYGRDYHHGAGPGLLEGSYRTAGKMGADGQIVGFMHPYVGEKRIEPWMLDAARAASQFWREEGERRQGGGA